MLKKIIKSFYFKLPQNYRYIIHNYYKFLVFFPRNIKFYINWTFNKHKNIKCINDFEFRKYSQNGEDGILKIIFYKIKPTNYFSVEFGVHPNEGNTLYLKKKGWHSLLMDGNGDGKDIKKEFITKDNINVIFKKYNVPYELDLLSIDIDSNDYYVWESLIKYKPRVVVIEYNSSIPYNQSKTVKYDPNLTWDKTNYFGASLLALKNLGNSKGYELIGCDNRGVNAFFIRKDLIDNKFEIKDIKKLYKSPKYGTKVNGKYIGHKKSDRNMIKI